MTTLDYLPTWEGAGACIGKADVMHPSQDPAELQQALDLCHRCPVLAECRDWVLSIPLHLGPGGVVAGMTPAERERVLLAHLPPRKCGDCRQVMPLYKFSQNTPGRAARRPVCKVCAQKRRPPSTTPVGR